MERSIEVAKTSAYTLYNHKKKVIALLVLTYGAKKAYEMYSFI